MEEISPCPKHHRKMIYWGPNGSTAFLLVGYCPKTISSYRGLAEEARKSFPALEDSDVQCGVVTRSASVDGFTLIRFSVPGERREIKGWTNYDCQYVEFQFT